eukprot:4182834-Prymnesium_polylepis.3
MHAGYMHARRSSHQEEQQGLAEERGANRGARAPFDPQLARDCAIVKNSRGLEDVLARSQYDTCGQT